MQFNLPYNWLLDYIDAPKDARDFAAQLSLYGATVEKIHNLSHDFSEVYVGEILDIVKHPNADKLQVATVSLGKSKHVIVCGAPNIAVGQRVPVAIPGAVLPGNFRIEKREVRGVTSDGMLCSPKELGFGSDHSGILILANDTPIGKRLVDLGTEKDTLLEIEPTTNRPDVASVLGVAREASAILGKKLKSVKLAKLPKGVNRNLRVVVKDTKRCQRFMALQINNVQVQSSPWWLQERLVRAGVRPINNIVDITNYIMLELGQPMHAFDADVVGGSLTVRSAKSGEKITALDGKIYKLQPHHLVITDAKDTPISLPGIMGGEHSGVTLVTKNIILEVATWDKVMIRKSARELQLTSDSAKLFEKGLSSEAVLPAMQRAVALVTEIAGGDVVPGVVDKRSIVAQPRKINFALSELNRHLGVVIPTLRVTQLLQRLGFEVKKGKVGYLSITVPHWRSHDVQESIDIVEEVARLQGYHTFASVLPEATFTRSDGKFAAEDSLKFKLQSLGFTETYSYSLVSDLHVTATGQDIARAISVVNPLSNDLQYLRPSLLPSLVEIIERNQVNIDDISLFEMAMVYERGGKGKGVDQFRTEHHRLSGVVLRSESQSEELFRIGKGIIESLIEAPVVWSRIDDSVIFDQAASANLSIYGVHVGVAGLLHRKFGKNFGVDKEVFAFELNVPALLDVVKPRGLQLIPKYPSAKRDISLVLDNTVSYTDIARTLESSTRLLNSFELFDIYRGGELGQGRQSYSLHLTFTHPERTLSSDEVDEALKSIQASLKKMNVTVR